MSLKNMPGSEKLQNEKEVKTILKSEIYCQIVSKY